MTPAKSAAVIARACDMLDDGPDALKATINALVAGFLHTGRCAPSVPA